MNDTTDPAPQVPPPSAAAPTATIPPIPAPGAPPGAGPAAYPSTTSFWESLDGLGVRRDRSRGWVGGVCVGLADRLRVDPLLIRALAVVLLFTGGVGLIMYLVAWLLLPDTTGQVQLREAGRGSVGAIVLIIALAVLVLSGLSFSDGPFWMGGWLFPAVVIALVVIYLANRPTGRRTTASAPVTQGYAAHAPSSAAAPTDSSTQGVSMPTTYAPPPAPGSAPGSIRPMPSWSAADVPPVPPAPVPPLVAPQPPRPQRRRAPKGVGAIVLGLAVLGYGLGFLLDGPTRFNGSGHFLGLLIALGVSSIAALALGLMGRRGGFASVLSVLLLLPVLLTAVAHKADLDPRSEDRIVTWVPAAGGSYQTGLGEATLDLSELVVAGADPAAAPRQVSITAGVGAGQLTVLVPPDVEVDLHASTGAGSIDVSDFGLSAPDGFGANYSSTLKAADGTPSTIVTLRANVGLGDLILKEK